jgi:hypothetical protein
MTNETQGDKKIEDGSQAAASPRTSSRRMATFIVLAIVAIGVMPLAAALYFRYVAPPVVKATVGWPLDPIPLPFELLQRLDGAPVEHPQVSGKWLVLFAAPGGCDERCQHTLYLTRQARTAQGRNMTRIDRLWLVTDATKPAPGLLAAHPDLVPVRATDATLLQVLGGTESRHINLVDRRGFLVFRYTDDPEPGSFIREIGKLIRF